MRAAAVSVGMPVYNGERYLESAVQAILAQSFTDFELIISDNGSADGSLAIAQRLARGDARIRVVANESNLGAAYNYRRVFTESRGRYFKWASCNDFCAPRHLERCVAALEQHPDAVLAYTRTILFADDPKMGTPYEEGFEVQSEAPSLRFRAVLENIRLNNLYNGVFRRAALESVPLAGDYMSSDIVMLAELALLGKFVELPEYDYFRRMDSESATALMSGAHLREHLLGRNGAARMQRWRASRVLFGTLLRHRLGLCDVVRVAGLLLRRMYWDLPKLAEELKDGIVPPASN